MGAHGVFLCAHTAKFPMNKPGRKPTGRKRKPLNITLPQEVKEEINRRCFRANISASEWIEGLVKRELALAEAGK